MRAAAALYVRRGRVFVAAFSETVDGFWIETDPRLESDGFEAAEASALLLEALEGSQLGVPTPPRDSIGTKLPALAGVKSFATFMRGAFSVDLSRSDEGTLTVTPMRNDGARGGFVPMVEHQTHLGGADQLADALVNALELAE
jgi:hypothetical protein